MDISKKKLTLREGTAIIGLLNEENILENLGILKSCIAENMKKKSAAKKAEKEKRK